MESEALNVGVTEGMGKGLKIVTLRLVRQRLERGSVWEMKGKVARVQPIRRGGDQDRAKSEAWHHSGSPGLSSALATNYEKQRRLEVWPLLPSLTLEGGNNEMILMLCDKGFMNTTSLHALPYLIPA